MEYWAESSQLRFSVIAPLDLLTAQHDVGDVLPFFCVGDVAGITELPEHACNLCIEGVTFVELHVNQLQTSKMSLPDLWSCSVPAWKTLTTLPSFLVAVYPNVFEVPECGFR